VEDNKVPVNVQKNATVDVSEPTQPPVTQTTPSVMAPSPKKNSGAVKKILAVLLVLVLIGGAGYGGYYYAKQQAQKEADAAIAELQAQIDDLKAKTVLGSSDSAANTKYVEITQWGVKLTSTPSTNVIFYQLNSSNSNLADFVSSEQKDLGGKCGTFTFSRYHVLRVQKGDKPADQLTANQIKAAESDSRSITIDDYNYYIIGDMSGGDCTGELKEGDSISAAEQDANKNLLTSLKSLVKS
jgi:hypothetical protein